MKKCNSCGEGISHGRIICGECAGQIEHMRELQQCGRIIEMPCAVGNCLYGLYFTACNNRQEIVVVYYKVERIDMKCDADGIVGYIECSDRLTAFGNKIFRFTDFGNTLFGTKQEAYAARERFEREGKHEQTEKLA